MSTSHRPYKGCQFCKPFKHKGNGRKVRDPIAVVRRMGKRFYRRHDLPDGAE